MRRVTSQGLFGLVLIAVGFGCVAPVAAITIRIDYSRDEVDKENNKFFSTGNMQGAAAAAQARLALEAAADFYSEVLEDTFSAINVPSKTFYSKGGEATFFWKRRFFDPTTGLNDAEVNPNIDANEYVIYVGARDLPGSEVGLAGPGGHVEGVVRKVGEFTSQENSEIASIAAQFTSQTKNRGESTGFARWGGSLAFDRLTDWHFDHTTPVPAGKQDFYSVALHELAHVLGLGASEQWDELVTGTEYKGANAVELYGGSVPVGAGDEGGHWDTGAAMSPIYEQNGTALPLMLPSILPSTRRLLTNLDAAALADIGWEIDLPGGAAQALTFASSGSSGSASVAALSMGNIPEPASALLLSIASAWLLVNRRRRL